VILFTLSRWSGGLLDRVGPRLPLTAGPAIAAAGFALLALPGVGAHYWTGFFPGICVLGFGMAVTVAPLTTTVMNAVGTRQAGVASGINNAVSRVAGLLAIALLGIVVTASFDGSLDRRLSEAPVSAAARRIPAAERARLGAARPPAGLPETEAREVRRAIAQALVASFRVVTISSAALALLASASAAWLIGRRGSDRAGPVQGRSAGQRPAARQVSKKSGWSLSRLSVRLRSRRARDTEPILEASPPSASDFQNQVAAARRDIRIAPAPNPSAKG
jgi:hypothetical protein